MLKEIKALLDVAQAEVGYIEKASNSQLDDKTANAGSNNYTKYARDLDNITGFYNGRKNGYSWCDIFVDWCFVKAFGVERAKQLLNHGVYGAGCGNSAQYFKNIGRFSKTPQIGSQIFFIKNGEVCHTGLVYNVDSSKVYTIEGNASSVAGVTANGGMVVKKSYVITSSYIYGYGNPAFKQEEETTTTVIKEGFEVITWKNGSTPESVYMDSACKNKIGSIDAWEKCECYGLVDGKYMVSYNVNGTNYHKVGFVKYAGGIK